MKSVMKKYICFLLLSISSCILFAHTMLPITIKKPLNKTFDDDVEHTRNGSERLEILTEKAKHDGITTGADGNILPCYAYYGIVLSGKRQPLEHEKEFYGIDLSLYRRGEYQDFYSPIIVEPQKFYGIVGGCVTLLGECDINGLQFGGWCDCNKAVKGLQIGVFSSCKDLYGAQINLLGSYIDSKMKGLQCAPLFNICANWCVGMQFGTFNFSGILCGAQLGIINCGAGTFGLQSGLLNMNICLSGAQIGIVNLTSESGELWDGETPIPIPGIQFGCINVGLNKSNVQAGLINWANRLNGVQIGLLNFKKGSWVPIPLLRISRD